LVKSFGVGSSGTIINCYGDMWRPLLWRREPLVVRKATLASVLAKAAVGIRFNAHMDFDDGEAVFYHTCLVSKRKDSTIAPVARRIGLSASASALINRNPKR
jgi:hypothetical protein